MNLRSLSRSFRFSCLSFGLLLVTTFARGQIIYNGTTSGSNTWGIAGNWSGGAVPASTATAEFGNSLTNAPNIDTSSYTVAQINFTRTSNLTLGGSGTLTVTTGITSNSGFTLTIAPNLTLGGASASAISVGSGSGLTLNGDISGSHGLTKTGAGTLTLSGLSSYTGGTTINAGKVVIAGGAYSSDGSSPIGNGSIAINGGTLGFTQNYDPSVKGLTIGSSGATFELNTAITFGTAVTGTGALTKTGTQTLTLNAANTYTGSTTISAGTLALGANGALPAASALTISSGATFNTSSANQAVGSIAGSGGITLGGRTLTVGSANTSTTFSGNVAFTSSGSLTKTGTGTLTLTGELGYRGATTVSGGTLLLGSSDIFTYQGNVYNAALNISGGTLDLGGFTQGTNGTLTLSSGALSNGTAYSTAYVVQSGTVSATLGGSGTLTKNTGGTVTLSGANTYAGSTYVYGGTLALSGSAKLGATNADLILNGGTLDLGGTTQTTGIVTFNSGTLTNGTLTGTSYSGLSGTAGAVLAGNGIALTKTTSDTLILSGANTYTGATTISAGTLQLGANHVIPDSSAVSTASGATLDLNGKTETITSISNAGSLTLNAGSLTASSISGSGTVVMGGGNLTIGNNTDATFASTISGTGSITKTGTNTLTLSANNTFTGTTTINSGTINIGGLSVTTGALAGPVVINSGGTLTLNRADATTFPGAISGAGTLNAAAPGGYAAVTFTGPLTLTGPIVTNNSITLNTSTDYTLPSAMTLKGLTKSGSGTVTLTGTSSSTGLINITAGTLAFGNGGSTGSISSPTTPFAPTGVVVSLGATLLINRSDNLTFGTLSGSGGTSGSLVKSGTNTVTLPNSDLSGTTTVNGGTLIFSGANISSGAYVLNGGNVAFTYAGLTSGNTQAVSGSGGLTLGNSTTLRIANSATYSGPTVLGTGSKLTLSSASSFTFASDVSGAGALELNATGIITATLTGNVAHTGGTTIADDILQVGNGGTTGSLGGNVAYTSGSTLAFNRSDTVTFAGNITGDGLTSQNGSGNVTLTGALSNGASNFKVAVTGTGTLTLAGSQAGNLTKTGTGMLISTIPVGSSEIRVNGGTLRLDTGASFAGANLLLGVSGSAGTLRLGDDNQLSSTVSLSFNTASGASTLDLNGHAQTVGAVGSSTTNSTFALGSGGALTFAHTTSELFNGLITGTGTLTKNGTGSLTLNRAQPFTGATTINAGTLSYGTYNVLPTSSAVTVASGATLDFSSFGGTLGSLAGAGSLTIGSGGDLTVGGDNTSTTFSGVITAPGVQLIKNGTGTLTLSADNTIATFNKTTTINNGTLQLGAGGTTGSIGVGNITNNGTLAVNRSSALTMINAISGSGALVKSGAGTLTLSGINTASGTTTINAGTLQFAKETSLYGNNSAAWTAAKLIVDSGATAAFNVGGTGEFTSSDLDTLAALGSASGGFKSGSFIGVDTTNAASGGTFTYNTAIVNPNGGANALGFVKLGIGTVILGGANTYSGDTLVNAGTLRLGAASGLSPNSKLTVASGAVFEANGFQPTVAELSGTGTVNTGTAGIILSHTNAQTFSGTLAGTGGFTKNGSGVLTLAGTHSLTGLTQINAGRIHLTGSAASSAFTVNSGGTLSGPGTLGALTINSGGTVSPGSSPGTLSSGATTFAAGGNYTWEINDAASPATSAGTRYDLLSITGTLAITATSVSPFAINLTSLLANNTAGAVINFNASANSSYTIATASGGITGFSSDKFSLNTSGFSNTLNGGSWSIGTLGNDLALTYTASAIPEPSTYALIVGVLTLTGCLLRRRRRVAS